MNKTSKMHLVLAAAVSLTLSSGAFAQFRVGTDGRALDANNRIGSGGLNSGYTRPDNISSGNFQNSLITGNVTGGKQFRGYVPYQSPDAFRGTTAGALSDHFIRSSSAAPYGGVPQNNAQVTQGFVGVTSAAPPPPGYVQQGYTGGAFVPGKMLSREPGDLRLGKVMDSPTTTLPQPGQFLMPGPVDPNTSGSTIITGSPLYGVRQWNTESLNDQLFLNSNMGRGGVNNMNGRMDPSTLEQMRKELLNPQYLDPALADRNNNSASGRNGNGNGNGPDQSGSNQNGANQNGSTQNGSDQNERGNISNQSLSGSTLTPMESPRNVPLGNSSILQSNQVQDNGALGGSMQTGASASTRFRPNANAAAQSTQYAEMQRRLGQYRIIQESMDAQSADARQNATATGDKKKPAANGPGTAGNNFPDPQLSTGTRTLGTGTNSLTPITPGGMGTARGTSAAGTAPPRPQLDVPVPSNAPAAVTGSKPAPVQIKSLAEGVQANGLASLLKDAEELMKQGKFNSALEKYDDAEQVAPNNPLILMGKANALLGQSYYARAERNLREAFTKDQALLLGQYDLRNFLSADRLEFLVNELKTLANSEQKEPRHVFLLAYIYYNTGHEAQAAAYLSLAEKRAGGNDPLYPLIRKYWSLPVQNEPAELLNK